MRAKVCSTQYFEIKKTFSGVRIRLYNNYNDSNDNNNNNNSIERCVTITYILRVDVLPIST